MEARRSDVDVRAAPLHSAHAQELIGELNAELDALYPPEANHFRLDVDEVVPGSGVFLVARLDRQPVGCGAVRLLEPGGRAELKRMYVRPQARGRRVGAALLAALEDHARRLGAREMVLETGGEQAAALGLYEKAGYTAIPRFGGYIDSPLSLCYAKALSA